MEAEYVALAEAAKEPLWITKLAGELTAAQEGEKLLGMPTGPLMIYSNNDAALILAKNPKRHQMAKHIDIKYHFIRDEYEARRISLQRVATGENGADILTKPLSKQLH
jgi:hypothetical protein